MTVGTQLHKCLADAESVLSSLKSFALSTQNQQAKSEYSQLAQQMEQTVNGLRRRVNAAEQEEPQYRVFQQAQQQAQQQQAQQQAQQQQAQQAQQAQLQNRQRPDQLR